MAEPKNMGAWTFVYFNLRTCLKHLNMASREVPSTCRTNALTP